MHLSSSHHTKMYPHVLRLSSTKMYPPLRLKARLDDILTPAADAKAHGVVCGSAEEAQLVKGLHHSDTGLSEEKTMRAAEAWKY